MGDPGTGKSGALSKLAIDMLRKTYRSALNRRLEKKNVEVPILVTAKLVSEVDNVNSLLQLYFEEPEIMSRFCAQVLMIDALDEITSEQRKEIIKKGETFSRELACSLVITSRKIDAVNVPPKGFVKYELLQFQFGQAVKFFRKLVDDQQRLNILIDGLEKVKFQILMIPLSLMLLVKLVQ